MNLTQLYRKAVKKPLKIYWWRYEYPKKLNFGDELTPYIVERLFNKKVVWSEPQSCELVGAGSIIEILQDLSGKNPIQVWGSGFIKPGDNINSSNLHFSAVRGRMSLDRISGKNVALGDPGLLMPLVFKPKKIKKYKLGIVPHYVDQDSPWLSRYKGQNVKIINVLEPIEKVISSITSCELILSSSLHGLIISDAYNIPNHWLPLSDSLTGGNYKFRDYYSVYDEGPVAISPKKLCDLDLDNLITHYKKKSRAIQNIQKSLIKSFPA